MARGSQIGLPLRCPGVIPAVAAATVGGRRLRPPCRSELPEPMILSMAGPIPPVVQDVVDHAGRSAQRLAIDVIKYLSDYIHSADAVLLAAADVVANATTKLVGGEARSAPNQEQPQLRDQRRDGSVVWDEFTVL